MKQTTNYPGTFWKTDPEQFFYCSVFPSLKSPHMHQSAGVSESGAFTLGIHLFTSHWTAGKSCEMSTMGCEGGATVSWGYWIVTRLSTKNAFQTPSVLSGTSKPDSGSILGPQEKRGRRLQQVSMQALEWDCPRFESQLFHSLCTIGDWSQSP